MSEILSPGEWLRRRRKALDLTQDELAARVGCSKELIAKIEQDARRPSKQVAERLAAQLQLTEQERTLLVRALRAELAADRLPDPHASVPRPTLVAGAVPPAAPAPDTRPLPQPGFLPAELNGLIGREREIDAVTTLLDRARLVTLTGPGGIGKTRLALAVSAAVRARYPGGIWFVDLSPTTSAEQIVPTIAQVLGVSETPGESLESSLLEWLHTRTALLLLDNCEQILEGAAWQAAHMLRSSPSLTVLATSRIPLRLQAEQEYPVEPLELPDLRSLPPLAQLSQYHAVALFIARARAVRPDFQVTSRNAPAIAEICHRLDGLPLAIELAAARVRAFSADQLLSRLATAQLPILAGGARDLPARQRTIQTTIAWSYRLLGAAQQRLFNQLAVFVSAWTLGLAEAVGGDMQLEVASELEVLVEHSLVRAVEGPTGVRYRMLETVREFGLLRLAESGEEALVRERFAAAMVDLAERQDRRRGEGDTGWKEPLQDQEANIDAAISWATVVSDDHRYGIRIAQALKQFWIQTTQVRRGLDYTRRLYQAYAAHAPVDRMRLRALQGHQHFIIEEHQQALHAYAEACAWLLTYGYPEEACPHLEAASRCARNRGDLEQAHALATQSRQLIETYNIGSQRHWNLMAFADIASDRGEYEQAVEHYTQALAVCTQIADPKAVGSALLARARTYSSMRRYDAALADFKTAYHVLEPFDPYMTAVTLTDMGWVLFAQGEHRELFECIRALAMNERLTPYEHQGVLFLAGYALLPTQPQRSTLLLAAATATENQVDDEVEMSADEQRVFDEHLHTLRSTLGEALFEELWARGQAMSWKQAIVVIQEGLAEQASATQAAVGATAGPRAP